MKYVINLGVVEIAIYYYYLHAFLFISMFNNDLDKGDAPCVVSVA